MKKLFSIAFVFCLLHISSALGSSNENEESTKHHTISWQQFANDTKALASKLKATGKSWSQIVAITRGGLVPTAILSHELKIRYVDTICISSYDDTTNQQKQLIAQKAISSENADILVIDDIVDTGATIKKVQEMLPKAYYATIYAKPEGKGLVDSYVQLVNQDTWVDFPWEVD